MRKWIRLTRKDGFQTGVVVINFDHIAAIIPLQDSDGTRLVWACEENYVDVEESELEISRMVGGGV